MSLVIDALSIIPLAMSDEDSRYSELVLEYIQEQGSVLAPPIFLDELQNVLLSAERRQRIEKLNSEKFVRRVLEQFPFAIAESPDRLEVMELARKTGRSFYDATYLALAQQEGVALATLDKKLANSAKAEGIALFGD